MKTPRAWRAQLVENLSGYRCAGMGTLHSHRDRVAKILKKGDYASLFAYLWRRFGPPVHGWDDHKEMVRYFLTTPMEGVLLGFDCSPGGLDLSVSYGLSEDLMRKCDIYERGGCDRWRLGFMTHCCLHPSIFSHMMLAYDVITFARGYPAHTCFTRDPFWASPNKRQMVLSEFRKYVDRVGPPPTIRRGDPFDDVPPVAELPEPFRSILGAIEATARDLLRPVNVRDVYINAVGEIPDEKLGRLKAVYPSGRAGFGCSPQLLDAGDSWLTLRKRIDALGGVDATIKQLNLAEQAGKLFVGNSPA